VLYWLFNAGAVGLVFWIMDTIRLTTWIDAPVERCFKLSTSIDLHIASAAWIKEEAIGGVTTGLIGEGEMVRWSSRHFGVRLRHTSRIEEWRPYSYFRDVMVDGVFQRYEHQHFFAVMDDGTRMRDEVRFAAPWGSMGRLATKMLVRKHLIQLLTRRNATIKHVAESGEWHRYLDGDREVPVRTVPANRFSMGGWDKNAVARR
jgi:ligand-binding SRPBCC domain-containing protein